MTLAEERGLGFVIDGVYVAKQRNMTDTDAMCHPRLQENILTGVVTHVNHSFIHTEIRRWQSWFVCFFCRFFSGRELR